MFREVAHGVLWLALPPFESVNVYLLGDVLVDAGMRFSGGRIAQALVDRPLTRHVLTHAHPDHQGASAWLCRRRGIPLCCGRGDREAVETGRMRTVLPPEASAAFDRLASLVAGPAHPVSHTLDDGDAVGDFAVVAAPGHTPGHLALWRESDGVLVVGDAVFALNPVTRQRGLRLPFRNATADPVGNVATVRRLAALRPRIVCFGHGPPLYAADQFERFAESCRG